MTDASPTLYVDRLVFVVCIVCAAFAAGLWIGDANVGRMDYEDALIAEAERAKRIATERSDQLIACLNGRSPGLYSENHRGERTYIVCRAAEEIAVGKIDS